jgi:hypothetical protein
MRKRIVIAAGAAALICSASMPSTRADDFEVRSRLLSGRALATNYSINLADYQALAEEAAKTYGPQSKTVMNGGTGKVVTTLDGKVMATQWVKARVEEVFGLLLVGRRRDEMARFPFVLKVSGQRERRSDVGKMVRARFQKQAPRLFDFNDFDWMNLWCWSQDMPSAGGQFADADPRFGSADLCLVRWRRGEAKTMLIGAVAADGGDWVRDASRPICRGLAAQWLDSPERSVQDTAIDYVGCVLVHDPDRGTRGARDTVVEHMYEVRPDRSLALIN